MYGQSTVVLYLEQELNKSISDHFLTYLSFSLSRGNGISGRFFEKQMDDLLPLFSAAFREEKQKAEEMTIDMILYEEGNEEGEDTLTLKELAENENSGVQTVPENENVQEKKGFIPHTEKVQDLEYVISYDYEALIEQFYTVDKSTEAESERLNAKKMLETDMSIDKTAEGPQILIYHTHSQEGYADSVSSDPATTIAGVGKYLAEILREQYGYQVMHHDGTYDLPSRDDAYSVALPEIERILNENPQIQVVIDLHRDAVEEGTRLVTEIDGKPTARFMFFNGLSRTRKTGDISYLYNGNLDANLAFSFQMQKAACEYYPGLTRKIYLKAYRYNMHVKPRTLLVELGAQNNTVEEAKNACEPLAHIIDIVLSPKGDTN